MPEKGACRCGGRDKKKNCAVCGKPLIYFEEEKLLECRLCHKLKPANAACEDGHFICDECHAGGGAEIMDALLRSDEKDPVALFLRLCGREEVHLHGPEHHSIVPCVLLTAYRNCGGRIDLERSLREAWKRGQKIAGGSCGFLGTCGAAAGAGIFASIVSGATPMTPEKWGIPQRLAARCLEKNAETGGPRDRVRGCLLRKRIRRRHALQPPALRLFGDEHRVYPRALPLFPGETCAGKGRIG